MNKIFFKKPYVFKKKIFFDKRGYFQELYTKKKNNINLKFTAIAYSKKGVIRGFHVQRKKMQTMLVSVIKGKITDYCIDLRKNSKNFCKVYKNIIYPGKLLYIPKGFAHGYEALEKENIILYHLSNLRDKKSEIGISWEEKLFNINWKFKKPILSKKDKSNITLDEFVNKFKGL